MNLPNRILILDGAMGTMIQQLGLSESDFHDAPFNSVVQELKGNNECLNITRPTLIRSIHEDYIHAGADIISTNTFSANRISQAEYGCEAFAADMAYQGACIAREAAGKKVLVAGSIGPTSKSLSLAPDISEPSFRPYSFDEMAAAYAEQVEALIRGGVDILLVETCFDALNTKAVLYAIERVNNGLPIMISVSASDRSGRTLTGQTMEAFYTSVCHYPLMSFGLNCSFGAEGLASFVREIASFSSHPVCCYPNAGLPNEMGGYDDTPAQMAHSVRKMALEGYLNIIGGCCGTTPEYIRAIRHAVNDLSPHQPKVRKKVLRVSGLEAYELDKEKNNFINIGERTNVAGSRKFARLIAAGDYESALQVAATQIENGASIIDINMDDAMLDSTVEMERFLRYVANDPAVAKAALMIDSSYWPTIMAGLKNAQGKCIVNSISLKEGEEAFLEKAKEIRRLGAAMVVMAFDELGQATTYDRKIAICERAYKLLTEQAGVEPTDIIFDCNILSIGTGIEEHANYAVDFIKAVEWIKKNLPGAYTSGGVSNLSFAFRGNNTVREAMHSAFLYHAIRAGLDMGIVNPGMLQVYDEIEPELLRCVEDVIFNRDAEATERLIDKAQRILDVKEKMKDGSSGISSPSGIQNVLPVEERLQERLIKGNANGLAEDVEICYQQYQSAVSVIEGPLMRGMERVGDMFGAGKMFLPQVVKSAKIMRDCVTLLQPYMTGETTEGSAKQKPRIVIATVKGDVHDIGKNITAIVFRCNGFEVTDLGVMVDKEVILDEALRLKADIIAVSGLITPSLFQMEALCQDMAARDMNTPLLIGGATTSALHTAVKLATVYPHVFYGADASASAVMAKRCMMDRERFEQEEHEQQEKIRQQYENRHRLALTDQEGESYPKESFLHSEDHYLVSMPTQEIPLKEILPFFDWNMFLAVWGIKYGSTNTDDTNIQRILNEGKALLERMRKNDECSVMMSLRIADGWNENNLLCADDFCLPMLRQEIDNHRSLCDFVPPKRYGFRSPFGLFAISVHTRGHHAAGCTCEQCRQENDGLFEHSIRLVLAEAASCLLDKRLSAMVARDDVKVIKPAAGYASCPDHTLKRDILQLLPDGERLGIFLTDGCTMIPDASICGMVFFHPSAGYPEIRHISMSQYERYATARGMSAEEARRFLGHLL
ncbi:MAG: methionine synthase [Prevotella sp.]|nr:methionine synthase [Prevotella sp.]MBQ6659474.1 methionine synthase [Prevotella sp.]MBQ7716823.1 methionine synthase [Prevotella sp.]